MENKAEQLVFGNEKSADISATSLNRHGCARAETNIKLMLFKLITVQSSIITIKQRRGFFLFCPNNERHMKQKQRAAMSGSSAVNQPRGLARGRSPSEACGELHHSRVKTIGMQIKHLEVTLVSREPSNPPSSVLWLFFLLLLLSEILILAQYFVNVYLTAKRKV